VTAKSFSPGYAPPEIVRAHLAKERATVAVASTDMWALGVVAFEMLTKQRTFAYASAQEMISRTAGPGPLPGEDPAAEAQARLCELRGLKRAILLCIDRDPAKRPTSQALLQSWNHMFESVRTSFFTRSSSFGQCLLNASRTIGVGLDCRMSTSD
jgi:serine/threonine protein kinase